MMQLAALPLNLPGPLMQALGDLDGLPEAMQGLGEGAEGDFWMRLAAHLQNLEGVAEALPEDMDAEALAAWLAASLSGENLPQSGKTLPPATTNLTLPLSSHAAESHAGGTSMREQLLASAVHAAAMASGKDGGSGQSDQDRLMLNLLELASAQQGRGGQESSPFLNTLSLASASAPATAAPTNTAALPRMFNLDVPMHQPGWDQALGERVKWMANQNVQVAEIRLNPPSLGPLEIRVHVEGDRTHVNFLAPQATTREAIDAALPRLREMFSEGGLSLGDVTVSHQDARHAQGQNGEGSSGQGGSQGNGQGHEDGETLNREVSLRQGLGLVDDYA
ncbi:MAG: flagellar hook-length control protein FliK [Thioalkalivibrio sp.]